jgi:hypothetical protein
MVLSIAKMVGADRAPECVVQLLRPGAVFLPAGLLED